MAAPCPTPRWRNWPRARKPLWIDLEYFSAEEWVPRFHLGSSIDAATRTRRWFFFPGVHAHSGGILRERGLVGARNAWQRPPGPRTHLCFGYPHAPYAEWLRALALPGAPLALWLCGQYTQAAFPAEQRAALPAGVTVRDLPFVAQPEFDQMLWSADVLWVRGEDSMARALWSGKPFVWQIYPQSERAHHPKLDAWLACYTRGFPGSLAAAYRDAHLAWNAIEDAPPFTDAWARLDALRDDWAAHSRARSDALAQDADLAQRLLAFIDQTPPPV